MDDQEPSDPLDPHDPPEPEPEPEAEPRSEAEPVEVPNLSDWPTGVGTPPADLGDLLGLLDEFMAPDPIGDTPTGTSAPSTFEDRRRPGGVRLNRIERFELLSRLGGGGGGVVMLAYDPRLERHVALKVPGPQVLGSTAAKARFLREARVLAGLAHPNIVQVYEAGDIGPACYLTMALCEWGSLASWLDRQVGRAEAETRTEAEPDSTRTRSGPPAARGKRGERPGRPAMPPRWAAELAVRLADALQHAHDANVLHRDLKPANILLRPASPTDGAAAVPAGPGGDPPAVVPLLADFSHCGWLSPDPLQTRGTASGHPLGTVPYSPPEQLRGDLDAIGPASDVYGLGAILFQLLTGRRPYPAGNDADAIGLILTAPVPSPRALNRGVPADLDAICTACLAKDPKDRYPTAAALADDLRRFLDGRSIARRPSRLKGARDGARRHRVALAACGLVALAALAIASVAGHVRQLERDFLHRQVELGDLEKLPALLRRLGPFGEADHARLGELFESGPPTRKLAAAIALAPHREDCARHALDALLGAKPEELPSLLAILRGQVPRLVERLEEEARWVDDHCPDRLAHDRRHAHAALALLHLGRPAAALDLLTFRPDPQALSLLVHALAPSGLDSEVALALLGDDRADPSVLANLLLALGEYPDATWAGRAGSRGRLIDRALALYCENPGPSVHGASKWLLTRHGVPLETVDRKLAGGGGEDGDRDAARWIVSPLGLTFVRFEAPAVRKDGAKRRIEMSDTEVMADLFAQFEREVPALEDPFSPSRPPRRRGREPAEQVSYHRAARFCNWLSERAGIAPGQWCYAPGQSGRMVPVPGHRDRAGYRLPSDLEFAAAWYAGTETASGRPCGDADELLGYYAWVRADARSVRPVGSLKPNDLGLFDLMGNVLEWCEPVEPFETPDDQGIIGGAYSSELGIFGHAGLQPKQTSGGLRTERVGFRVVRTLRPLPDGEVALKSAP